MEYFKTKALSPVASIVWPGVAMEHTPSAHVAFGYGKWHSCRLSVSIEHGDFEIRNNHSYGTWMNMAYSRIYHGEKLIYLFKKR